MPRTLKIVEDDPTLQPHLAHLRMRTRRFDSKLKFFEERFTSLENVATAHHHFGFTRGNHKERNGVWYREWAPGADALHLIGDFNGWNRSSHPLTSDDSGIWDIFLSDSDYADVPLEGSRVKVCVTRHATRRDRIPAYALEVSKENGHDYCGVIRFGFPYDWRHRSPVTDSSPRIYEAHVGMAQEKRRKGSFEEFRKTILPRIVKQGYTCIQLMGVQQHPYYASFGYHVSNFFAVSDHFGTAVELKRLIDDAHGMGIRVFMDVVHSHSVKNVHEGLNDFDGSGHHYFHPGMRGNHPAWDSKVFNYGRREVVRFLLSNLRYWLEEFHFDGFRFDGVGSMLYLDHGFMRSFGGYEDYFDDKELDHDGIVYLQLANALIHRLNPKAITIAEDVSGMPGTAYPIADGGLGFDYRMAMGIPDHWVNFIKHLRDEDWPMRTLSHLMKDRRACEKSIAYCESHDQSIVGDVPLAQQLMGRHMPDGMSVDANVPQVARGMALHNLIRFVTFALGGEGWLNFIGNEFGHPDWVDFPREGNDFSYDNAHRRWSLVDDPKLKYRFLNAFDNALQRLDERWNLLGAAIHDTLRVDDLRKVMIARRAGLIFVFNFHPTHACDCLEIPGINSLHELELSSVDARYGGDDGLKVLSWNESTETLRIRLPARSGGCLAPVQR